jgi:hypothetical protein
MAAQGSASTGAGRPDPAHRAGAPIDDPAVKGSRGRRCQVPGGWLGSRRGAAGTLSAGEGVTMRWRQMPTSHPASGPGPGCTRCGRSRRDERLLGDVLGVGAGTDRAHGHAVDRRRPALVGPSQRLLLARGEPAGDLVVVRLPGSAVAGSSWTTALATVEGAGETSDACLRPAALTAPARPRRRGCPGSCAAARRMGPRRSAAPAGPGRPG